MLRNLNPTPSLHVHQTQAFQLLNIEFMLPEILFNSKPFVLQLIHVAPYGAFHIFT